MDPAPSTNGRYGEPGGTGLAVPREEPNGALPERLGEPSANGTHDAPGTPGARVAPAGTGTRDARGRFTFGNPGRPRRRTGPPSPIGDNGGGPVATADPAPPPAAGRDATGRFIKGNPGGPGNPFARRVAALRQAPLRAITEEDVRDLAGRLLEAARGGDLAAMKLLLGYVLGRPAEVVDPDTLDLQEWQLYQQSLAPADEVHGMLHRIPPEFGLVVLRTALPALAGALGSEYLKVDAWVNGKRRPAHGEDAPAACPPPDRSAVTNR